MSTQTGTSGGFVVPTEFMARLLQLVTESSIVRPRATIIPMSAHSTQIPALDITPTSQTAGDTAFLGGVVARWTEEAATLNETENYELPGYTQFEPSSPTPPLPLIQRVPASPTDGEWRCTGLVVDGETQARSTSSAIRLAIFGRSWHQEARGLVLESFEVTFKPDGTMTLRKGDVTLLGRYELRRDRLRVAYPGPLEVGKRPRPPADLTSAPIVAEWRRAD